MKTHALASEKREPALAASSLFVHVDRAAEALLYNRLKTPERGR